MTLWVKYTTLGDTIGANEPRIKSGGFGVAQVEYLAFGIRIAGFEHPKSATILPWHRVLSIEETD